MGVSIICIGVDDAVHLSRGLNWDWKHQRAAMTKEAFHSSHSFSCDCPAVILIPLIAATNHRHLFFPPSWRYERLISRLMLYSW
jgi:hypothetical protein